MNTRKQIKTQMQSQSGFTFLEILVSITILSFGILGLLSTSHSVNLNQKNADDSTEATLIASDQLENAKRVATNEPLGGIYGFTYFVDDSAGFLASYNVRPNNYTREIVETNTEDSSIPVGFTRTTTVQSYPSTVWSTENFDTPDNIHMVEVRVNVAWVDGSGATKNIAVSTAMQRRQFIQ